MKNNIVPAHVAIIMDGNGRWAKSRGKERVFGHNEGTESVRECTEYAVEKGIKYLSLFAFSEENWNRPNDEVQTLMGYMLKAIINETPVFLKNNIKFKVIGDMSKLSSELKREIDICSNATKENSGLNLLIYLSYSGKWDITQAVNKILEEKGHVQAPCFTPQMFEQYLSTYGIPDPDLLIRTGGEERISNFMLWQCAYTELYFTQTLWPDFRKIEFQQALNAFFQRDRRFGKV